jgi:hypothetical protein
MKRTGLWLLLLICIHSAKAQDPDLKFYPDPGIRVLNAGIPNINYDPVGETYYLFYDASGDKHGPYVSTSQDGFSFTEGSPQTDYVFDPRAEKLPDGMYRYYYFTPPGSGVTLRSQKSTDGINFEEDPLIHYELQPSDNDMAGVFDIFVKSDGMVVLDYLGDMYGLNNLRRAVSVDSGKTFQFERSNVLNDSINGGGPNSFVDARSILLANGDRRLFCMRQMVIYSFTSKDGGETYIKDPGIRLEIPMFKNPKIYSLNDPAAILLSDGTYRIYIAAQLNEGQCGPGQCQWAIVSATTKLSVNSIQGNETCEEEDINIFPNPVNSEFIIDFGRQSTDEFKIEVYSILGEKLIEKEGHFSTKIRIDLHNYRSGIYFVLIEGNDKIKYKSKVVLIR